MNKKEAITEKIMAELLHANLTVKESLLVLKEVDDRVRKLNSSEIKKIDNTALAELFAEPK
ncbi:MAG: hypothetical protein Q4C60_09540 [Eubacteriales bacterium]|nr:hypothetical protein [Eubacteriales bacterium]